MKLLIPFILLSISLSAGVLTADYVADVRFGPSDEDILTLPFDENHEIHKAPDATLRYPVAFEDGQPVEHAESKLGLSLDLTEFECDGENVSYVLKFENVQFDKWQVIADGPAWRFPTFRSISMHLHGISGKLGEWIDYSSSESNGCRSEDTGFRPSLRIRRADSGVEENE